MSSIKIIEKNFFQIRLVTDVVSNTQLKICNIFQYFLLQILCVPESSESQLHLREESLYNTYTYLFALDEWSDQTRV